MHDADHLLSYAFPFLLLCWNLLNAVLEGTALTAFDFGPSLYN